MHIFGSPRRYLFLICSVAFLSAAVSAQVVGAQEGAAGQFRVGERISYYVSLDKFKNVAFVETYVASRGSLADQNVVEVRSRVKTEGFVSAAIALIDEARTDYLRTSDGSPLLISRSLNGGVSLREIKVDNTTVPQPSLDLIAALFKARAVNGSGSFAFAEDGQESTITFLPEGSDKVSTDQGTFESTVIRVTSPYFEYRGIKDVKLWLAATEARMPVAFSFKTRNGTFKGTLASYLIEAQPETAEVPGTPVAPIPTPTKPAVRPTPSPTPYVENRPLLPELKFALGEVLDYRVTKANVPVGSFQLLAKERKFLNARDTLVLEAKVTGTDGPDQALAVGDSMTANVDPDSLGPATFVARFSRGLSAFSQNAIFDQRTGIVTFGPNRAEGPVGVHSLLSLIYAMRSFNLTADRDAASPVNDTRVAVFWRDKVQIFSLRPSKPSTITVDAKKIEAQLVTIVTGDPAIDQAGLKVWLSMEPDRVPLRFMLGSYQADLVRRANLLP